MLIRKLCIWIRKLVSVFVCFWYKIIIIAVWFYSTINTTPCRVYWKFIQSYCSPLYDQYREPKFHQSLACILSQFNNACLLTRLNWIFILRTNFRTTFFSYCVSMCVRKSHSNTFVLTVSFVGFFVCVRKYNILPEPWWTVGYSALVFGYSLN